MPAPLNDAAPSSDVALFGMDPAERLVAVHPRLGGPYAEQAVMRLYRRSDDGTRVLETDQPFYPFFVLADILHKNLPHPSLPG